MSSYKSLIARNQLLIIVVLLLFFAWPAILSWVFDFEYDEVLPSVAELVPGLLAFIVITSIKSSYGRLIGYVWFGWYFIGALNTLASSVILGSYFNHLLLGKATVVYFLGCFCYFSGVVSFEHFRSSSRNYYYSMANVNPNIGKPVGFLLLVFPFIWLASLYAKLGYLPLISNVDLVGDMYELDYGLIYPYGVVMVLSILYAGLMSLTSTSRQAQLAYLTLLIFLILISTADGKRTYAMISIGGLTAISFKILKEKTWTRILPAISAFLIALYVGVLLVRVERSGNGFFYDAYGTMMLVGSEFRDYVYAINFFNPGEIDNYSYAASSLASLTNQWIFWLIGLDKNELVNLDSAHAWAQIYGSSLGIRTGLISELWFAYGVFGMFILFVFGFASGALIEKIKRLNSSRGLLFAAAAFGLLLIAITNQSTVTFGVLPTFLYLYIIIWILDKYLA